MLQHETLSASDWDDIELRLSQNILHTPNKNNIFQKTMYQKQKNISKAKKTIP